MYETTGAFVGATGPAGLDAAVTRGRNRFAAFVHLKETGDSDDDFATRICAMR